MTVACTPVKPSNSNRLPAPSTVQSAPKFQFAASTPPRTPREIDVTAGIETTPPPVTSRSMIKSSAASPATSKREPAPSTAIDHRESIDKSPPIDQVPTINH